MKDIGKLEEKIDLVVSSLAIHYIEDYDSLCKKVYGVLKEGEKLLLCYFWNTTMTVKGFSIEPFSSIEAEKIKVPGISKNAGKNSILVYTKKK